MPIAQELTINSNASAVAMAEAIFGAGVSVEGATYTGDNRSSGIFSDGDSLAPGATPSDEGVILSTGRVSNYTNSSGSTNTNVRGNTSTNTSGQNNNAQFNAAAGTNTYDASYIDIDFIPDGNVMTMQFIFASEEYPEFQNSVYQDFVGVWINGQQVEMVVGNGDTDPGNINNTNNQNLYQSNTGDQFNTEMDGLTITMTLTIPVNEGDINSIRIGIADVSDSSYDSSLLIAGDSVQTALVASADDYTMNPNATKELDVLANDTVGATGTLTITHINGVEVTDGMSVTLSTGQTVTLVNGKLEVTGDGDTENFSFTYGVEDGLGNSDTGFVTVDSVPCFVAGTMIETLRGQRPVEALEPGDLVLTRDDGPQPLRWVGMRTVPAKGALAPVRIEANTLGQHNEIWLSPQHRVLITDQTAELLFGEAEVLVAAKSLLPRAGVSQVAGGDVTYVHLLFDRHQVVQSEGLATESFLPGPQITNTFEAEAVEEICAIFPEFDRETGDGYGVAARRMLKSYEAQALLSDTDAA
ncbi:Hint domain-containing protein [Roseobacteraceae bacterium S113]